MKPTIYDRMKHILSTGPVWIKVRPACAGCVLPPQTWGEEHIYLYINPDYDVDLLMDPNFGFSATLMFDGKEFLVTIPYAAVDTVTDCDGNDHLDLKPEVGEVMHLKWRSKHTKPNVHNLVLRLLEADLESRVHLLPYQREFLVKMGNQDTIDEEEYDSILGIAEFLKF